MAANRHVRLVSIIAAGATVTACTGSLTPGVCDDGVCGSQRTITKTFQQTLDRDLDMLFVIDDTDAIGRWVDNLRTGYPAMAHLLQTLPDGAPDVHVGFVRASRCATQTRARDCGVRAPYPFLLNELCGATSNFAGSFADTFTCMADFGTQACATAQPFQAVRDVFAQPPPAAWDGFLRPDATLQIVIIAGRDDASDMNPLQLAALVKALKADPARILVAVIGPAGAPRLIELVQQFGGNGLITELAGDPTVVLHPLTRSICRFGGPACFAGVLDVDPLTPGVQGDCTFVDTVTRDGTQTTRVLPACDTATPPCWRLIEWDNGGCVVPDIDRGADWCPAARTTTRVECLSATM
jgi:hypothetical protein